MSGWSFQDPAGAQTAAQDRPVTLGGEAGPERLAGGFAVALEAVTAAAGIEWARYGGDSRAALAQQVASPSREPRLVVDRHPGKSGFVTERPAHYHQRQVAVRQAGQHRLPQTG